jgi:glycosyltransferase involved in cell wall biosynthesis
MSWPTTADLSRIRVMVLVAGCGLVVLAVSGVLNAAVFAQPNTIKYVVTVAGSALVTLLALTRAPLKILVGLAIVVAPFDFVMTFDHLQITPLLAVDVLALLVWLSRSRTAGSPALRPMAGAFVLLLLPAIVGSNAVGVWVLWLAVTVVTGCLAFVIAREPGGPAYIASMLVLSGLIQAALAIWEQRTGHQLNLYQGPGTAAYGQNYFFSYGRYDRPPGALPDPIGLGQVLALCIPIAVSLAAYARRTAASLVVLAAAGVSAIALLLSLSRMSIVGVAFGLAVAVLLLPRTALLKKGGWVAAMAAGVAVIGLALGGTTLSQRLDSILHPTASHVSTAPGDLARARIWSAALKTAEAHPVTGVGFGNVTNYMPRYGVPVTSAAHAHDTYLQFFAEGGVLGLLALVGIFLSAGVDLARGFSTQRVWVAGAAGALVATALSWITDVEVRYAQVSAMVAVLLGLIAALAVRERSPAEEPASQPAPDPSLEDTLVFWPAFAPQRVAPSFAGPTATLAVISPSREDGGAEGYLRTIVRAAAERGWAVRAALPPLSATARLRDDLVAIGASVRPLRLAATEPRGHRQALISTASDAWVALRVLRQMRPDAIMVVLPHPDQAPGLVLAAALHRAHTVVNVQLVPPDFSLTHGRRALYGLCRSRGQRWVAVSAENRRGLAAALGWPEHTIEVIHNGVDDAPRWNGQRAVAASDLRSELGLPADARVVLTVGRLNQQKGYDLIAGSIPAVVSDHPNAYWVWAGDGPERTSLTRQLEAAGVPDRVKLLGLRDDVERLLAAADLFVFPSRYEGAPFALLEAMRARLPVVVSDAGPLPEIVRDEVEGRVVPAGDREALSRATSWALDHPEQMRVMGLNGRRRVVAEFSQDAMTKRTFDLLRADGRQTPRGQLRRALAS